MRTLTITFALFLVLCAGGTHAAESTATVDITGTVVSSLTMSLVEVPGIVNSGQTTLGTLGYFHPILVSNNLTYSRLGEQAIYSSSLVVRTIIHGSSSPSYTLQASYSGNMPSGVSWTLRGATLSTTSATIASQVAYGDTTHNWNIILSKTAAVGSYSTTLLLTAVSN